MEVPCSERTSLGNAISKWSPGERVSDKLFIRAGLITWNDSKDHESSFSASLLAGRELIELLDSCLFSCFSACIVSHTGLRMLQVELIATNINVRGYFFKKERSLGRRNPGFEADKPQF